MNKLVGLSLGLLLATVACGSQVVDFPIDKTTDNGDSAVDAGDADDDGNVTDGNVDGNGDDVITPSDDASDANVGSDDASDGSVSNDGTAPHDASDSDGPIRGRIFPDAGTDSGIKDAGETIDAGNHTDAGNHADAGVCYHKSCTEAYDECVCACESLKTCKTDTECCIAICEHTRSKCDDSCGNTDCE
jgi:hypothetical protein